MKIAIIGKGTAGCFAVSHFLKHTDWKIDWYFDSSVQAQAVGEGSTVDLPPSLFYNLDFTPADLDRIYGSPKLGIKKQAKQNNTIIFGIIRESELVQGVIITVTNAELQTILEYVLEAELIPLDIFLRTI